jgi:TolB-like protein
MKFGCLDRRLLALAAFSWVILCGSDGALAADKRLAVLEFQGGKIEDETLRTLTDTVRGGALEGLARSGIDVMTRENMMAMLKAMGKAECQEGECEVETARNIGADYVVSGSVARIESLYVVTLKIHESKGGTLLATDMVKGKSQVEVLDQLREHGRDLLKTSLGRSRSSSGATGREKRIEAEGEPAINDERVLVKFESEPVGATVLLDGQLLCKETPCSRSVLAGRHEVEMHKERHERAQQSFEPNKGVLVRLTLPSTFAILVIRTEPAGLPVAVDGKIIAQPGAIEIEPGQHEVVVDHPCYQRTGEQVVVQKGQRRDLVVVGSPRLSVLAVAAEDERGDEVEAKVAVDGVAVGTTPGTFKVNVCSKELLVLSDHGSFRGKLALVEKDVNQLRVKVSVGAGGFASGSETTSATYKVSSAGPTPGDSGSGWRTAGVITSAVGVVGLGLGLYCGIHAKSIADEVTSSPTFSPSRDDDRKQAITLQYVGYTVGGVALASGLVMYWLGRSGSQVALVPGITPSYAGLSLQIHH